MIGVVEMMGPEPTTLSLQSQIGWGCHLAGLKVERSALEVQRGEHDEQRTGGT
jgi:hypothetical protein